MPMGSCRTVRKPKRIDDLRIQSGFTQVVDDLHEKQKYGREQRRDPETSDDRNHIDLLQKKNVTPASRTCGGARQAVSSG
jgi:hypothetical protein